MEDVHSLGPVLILLVMGIVAALLVRPLKVSPIVGYLIAGMVIGPDGFALIQESQTTHLLADLGVVFLLFDIGLHFSLPHIWNARRDMLGLGPLQIGLCTVVLAMLALLTGLEVELAFVIGATLALSSTAVVVQLLAEYGQLKSPVGISAIAVLIFQDICAIFLLILATSLEDVSLSSSGVFGWAAFKAAAAFAVAIFVGHFLIGPLFGLISKSKDEGIFTATGLFIVLGTAAATGVMGLSLTLGAFLGGMVLSETPYRHVIQTEVKPFRGLLLAFFFATVGMSLDIDILLREWPNILLFLLLLITIKTGVMFLAARAMRKPARSAIQLGFLLTQGSEFAFVIVGMPALQQVLGQDWSAIFISTIAASMMVSPPLAMLGHRLAMYLADKDWQKRRGEEAVASTQIPPVIIFGMGEVGCLVADGLEAHGISYSAIEMRHDQFIKANADGYPVMFGDVSDLRMKKTMEMGKRATIVLTIARYETSRELAPIVQERYPNLTRFVAVETEEDKQKFESLGMKAIVTRSVPKGIALAAAVLMEHHVSGDKVQEWMREVQEEALSNLKTELDPIMPLGGG